MKTDVIYLDHNATTPVDPKVLEAMLPYFNNKFGNPASVDHEYGLEAKKAVDNARKQITEEINAHPEEIIFTSGATESNNIAIFGVAEKYASKGDHIITCVTEHKAVLDVCAQLEKSGKRITYLPVDKYGSIDCQKLKTSITPNTILITIMAANNEIGTIAPITEIGAIAREHGVFFHTDAAQAFGHIPIDVQEMNIDIMSLSAHKMYGPKGMGALYRRRSNPRVKLPPLFYGGGHERGIRSGTLNVPAIVGFGKAASLSQLKMAEEADMFSSWTQNMYNCFMDSLGKDKVALNGHPTKRLPHNINISFQGIESRALILNLKNIAVSTGSACTATIVEPSHVINALGFSPERAHSAIRMSVGRFNTKQEIDVATQQIIAVVKKLRKIKDLSF